MKILFLAVVCAAMCGGGYSMSIDPDATADLEQYIRDDFTISLRHIRPRKKAKISIEALFIIDFPAVKNKYSFYLDRKSKRVTIDINANSQMFSKHLSAPMLNETTTVRSLALSFSQNSVTLYVDCKSAVKEELEFNLSKLYLNMDEPEVKLMRERKYPLFLDKKTDSALSRANCQKPWKPKGSKKTLKDIDSVGYYSDQAEYNRKRGRREHRNSGGGNRTNQVGNSARRGDISVIHGDCDENLLARMNDLIALVKKLEKDISNQHGDIRRLQSLIENCAGC